MPTAPSDRSHLRALIRFTPSAAFELLLSIGLLQQAPARRPEWTERVQAALGPDTLAELNLLMEDLWHPLALLELPVDYAGPSGDPDAFLTYVANLDAETFLFYYWGRLIPRDEVAAMRADPALLTARIHSFYEDNWPGDTSCRTRDDRLIASAREPQALQARLVGSLRTYNAAIFRGELPELRRQWAVSVQEKQQALAAGDARELLNGLLPDHSLPTMFPEGTPLRALHLVPSLFTWKPGTTIWGYGTLFIIYDARVTEQQERAREQVAETVVAVAGALADKNRLRILAAIACDADCYGHKLARICGISQPAVSRHMGILKRAGLVEEVPSDGRLLYRLCRPAVEAFLPQLLQYLEA